MIPSKFPIMSTKLPCACAGLLSLALLGAGGLGAQSLNIPASGQAPNGPTAQSFQGSISTGEATAQPIDLSLDDAIARGLKTNLGVILSGIQTGAARGQRLNSIRPSGSR